jgi:hypothetical protein
VIGGFPPRTDGKADSSARVPGVSWALVRRKGRLPGVGVATGDCVERRASYASRGNERFASATSVRHGWFSKANLAESLVDGRVGVGDTLCGAETLHVFA